MIDYTYRVVPNAAKYDAGFLTVERREIVAKKPRGKKLSASNDRAQIAIFCTASRGPEVDLRRVLVLGADKGWHIVGDVKHPSGVPVSDVVMGLCDLLARGKINFAETINAWSNQGK